MKHSWQAAAGTDLAPAIPALRRELALLASACGATLGLRDTGGVLLAGEETVSDAPVGVKYALADVAFVHGVPLDSPVLPLLVRQIEATLKAEVTLRDFARQTARQWSTIAARCELSRAARRNRICHTAMEARLRS